MDEPEEGTPVVVSFSVKELLADIRSTLDRMEGRLIAKVDGLETRISDVEDRVRTVEIEQQHASEASKAELAEKRFITPVRLTWIIIAISVVQLFVAYVFPHIIW